jgi:soluble lytic murein transglycosylase-like protein
LRGWRFSMRLFLSFRWSAAIVVAALSLPCFAADVAILRNGFSIRHERREVIGDVTRMYTSVDGSSYVDVPTAEIDHFEVAETVRAASESEPAVLGAVSGAEISHANSVDSSQGASCELSAGSQRADCRKPKPDLDEVVNAASGRYRLDPDLVNSVIKAESGFNVRAVSPKGAQGLMQLMPKTASALGVPNAFDPQANVDGGARYLRELLERYNFDLVKALAAYNAGTRRVEQYGGVPPYYETRAYVRRIVLDFNKKKLAQKTAATQKSPAKKTNGTTRVPAAKRPNSQSLVEAKARPVQASE